MISKREHKGIYLKNGTFIKEITCDNRWNMKDDSIANYKKQILTIYNYHVIIVSKNDCTFSDDNEKYIFALLDNKRRVIIDFTYNEYQMLVQLENNVIDSFNSNDNTDSPYHNLKQAFDNLK
jgi:hypothetical protein